MNRAWRNTCLLMLVGPFALVAQTPSSADMAETIQALLARIDRLEKRVADLEGTAAAAGVAPACHDRFHSPAGNSISAAPSREPR